MERHADAWNAHDIATLLDLVTTIAFTTLPPARRHSASVMWGATL
jgi:hypothetical protein